MTTIEQIEHLIKEIGPAMPEVDAIVQTEDPSWAIQFSDETIIILEPADDPSRVVISTELGAAVEAQQRRVYETMLCYNLMWRDSGGVKIGLAGPQGALIISTDVCIEGLTLQDLKQEIERFLQIARSWTQYVGKADAGEAPPLPGMDAGSVHLHA
ncbi:MAG: type III secretion system chaperone [Burkholderiaceae bacterium]|jgi:hypothetical protein